MGYDAGEWGGSLHWYARDGSQHAQLATRNVHGLVAFGPNEVVALEGLNHMSLRDGNARWLERVHGAWRVGTLARLDAGPVTYATDRDTIYVVTATSLTRIGRDRRAVVVHPLPKLGTQANSMVIDDSGRLWIGMRQLVLRLTRMGERFEAEWLVHASCRHAARRDLDCVCVGG
ncbi:MAG: hypothetical protein H0T79_02250 [Deltaproteobacteria bacterium]|nr:hypothetical protein [Deltaproteobacteria bacterium]